MESIEEARHSVKVETEIKKERNTEAEVFFVRLYF